MLLPAEAVGGLQYLLYAVEIQNFCRIVVFLYTKEVT